ncbi:hypothetical protein [Chryseobacterium tongliaoense]|uniref:hypothetical protein n=1 Tax=Chryseobacterium tongliaoense TaxID=3240933 RepID=UPI003516AF7A
MNKINILKSDSDYRKLAEFIIKENYSHHTKSHIFSETKTKTVYHEELYYKKNSIVYTLQDIKDEFVGSIRVLKWNFTDILPIQKIFSIHPFNVLNKNFEGEVWHIGRFAIRRNEGIIPLKKLMTLAIQKVCENKGNIAFAECDTKLLKILYLMGIEPKIVGHSKYYLGSETIPVLLEYDNLLQFYHKNKHLVYENPKTVIEKDRININPVYETSYAFI